MKNHNRISVIIPAYNEEQAIAKVLEEIPKWVDHIMVVDNNSTDRTGEIAAEHGARVVRENKKGYGTACLTGIAHLPPTDVVVFLDGDHSDYPQEMAKLVSPILEQNYELVIGSRTLGNREPGALPVVARFGNALACSLLWLFWRVRFTDLGPFRAITYPALIKINMQDPNFGWTVEMQIKAVLHHLKLKEIPVDYRKRIGKSKISGTLSGIIGAGTKILATIFLSALRHYFRKQKEQK